MQKIANQVLTQLSAIIQQLSKEDYVFPLPILMNNSIGKHVRHVLDLFECLIHCSETGIVNYDDRKRNPETENDKELALNKIQTILEKIDDLDIEKKVILHQKLNNAFYEIDSSVERELLYNIEHCVHHLAIIRIGIENNCSYVKIPENFGVAHSTISHREQTAG